MTEASRAAGYWLLPRLLGALSPTLLVPRFGFARPKKRRVKQQQRAARRGAYEARRCPLSPHITGSRWLDSQSDTSRAGAFRIRTGLVLIRIRWRSSKADELKGGHQSEDGAFTEFCACFGLECIEPRAEQTSGSSEAREPPGSHCSRWNSELAMRSGYPCHRNS